MKKKLLTLLLLAAGPWSLSGAVRPPALIPVPVSLEMRDGFFRLAGSVRIACPEGDSLLSAAAFRMARSLGEATGLSFTATDRSRKGGIRLERMHHDNPEAYELEVNPQGVRIAAVSSAGYGYALQTLLQLMPPEVYGKGTKPRSYLIPAVKVVDYPRFRWRGMHLDVSRHFYPVELIYRYIDLLALHKMNVFHWHLTDDQGWRIEIRKYPRLTDVSAWRVDRSGVRWDRREHQKPGETPAYGGFYTREQIRGVVAYAAERGVTVVPEIEMPGHSSEVFAAYPELSCTGEPRTVNPGGVYPKEQTRVFCAGNDKVFVFLEGVLDEVIDLFPSPYIHIGGDEARKDFWKACPACQRRIREEGLKDEEELQSYFMKRIERHVQSRGRRVIGWDEILQGGLPPEATVLSWRGEAGGIAAARQGHDVVMAPSPFVYFNYHQNYPGSEPLGMGGFLPLKKVYRYEPVPAVLTLEEARHIIGGQGCLWGEVVETPAKVEYMVTTRMAALAENLWSPKEKKDWEDFMERMYGTQVKRYGAMGVNYHPGPDYVDCRAEYRPENGAFRVTLEADVPGVEIRYTTDGSEPDAGSVLYTGPFDLRETVRLRAVLVRDGKVWSRQVSEHILGVHLAFGKKAVYAHPPREMRGRPAEEDRTLNDGLTGDYDHGRRMTRAFMGVDMDVTFDLEKSVPFRTVIVSSLQSIRWPQLYHPEEIVVYTSEDGEHFKEAARRRTGADYYADAATHTGHEIEGDFRGRYVRVVALCPTAPAGNLNAGKKTAMYIDEVFVF